MSQATSLKDSDVQYHIKLKPGQSAPYVIVPGDPGRVPQIAAYLDQAIEVANNREYKTYRGTYRGVDVSVTSTGIGGPSAAIAFEELIRVGAKVLIRVGTSGALQDHLQMGDLVIAQSAIRDEGTSRQYVPLEWPATADFDTCLALKIAAEKRLTTENSQLSSYVGTVHSKDAFYAEEPKNLPTGVEWEQKWAAWQKMGCYCTEMEAATLFTVAQLHHVKSAAILTVIGETKGGEVKIAKVSNENAIMSALEAIYALAQAKP